MIENRDAIIVAIFADEDVAFIIESNIRRKDKLPRPSSQAAPLAHLLAGLGIVNCDTVIMCVGNIDQAVGPDGKAHGFS